MPSRHLSYIVVSTIAMLTLSIVGTVCYSTIGGNPVHADGFQTLKEWGLVLIGGLVGFIAPFRLADGPHPHHEAPSPKLVVSSVLLIAGAGFCLAKLQGWV